LDNAPLANPPALPRLVFVHHAGITDALDDHDRDEFAEAVILPALPPYAYMKHGGRSEKSDPRAAIPSGSRDALCADMKLGAMSGFVGISLPVKGHETHSLLHGSC
jgi:hypothetical protein